MSLKVSIVLVSDRLPVKGSKTKLISIPVELDEVFSGRTLLLVEVQIQFHHFIFRELHDQVRVSSLTLSNRRIDVDYELGMNVVGFR